MTLSPTNEKNKTQCSKRVSMSYLIINGNMLNRPDVKLMLEILAKDYLLSLEIDKIVFVFSKFYIKFNY